MLLTNRNIFMSVAHTDANCLCFFGFCGIKSYRLFILMNQLFYRLLACRMDWKFDQLIKGP